jgi:hypothetical protein
MFDFNFLDFQTNSVIWCVIFESLLLLAYLLWLAVIKLYVPLANGRTNVALARALAILSSPFFANWATRIFLCYFNLFDRSTAALVLIGFIVAFIGIAGVLISNGGDQNGTGQQKTMLL